MTREWLVQSLDLPWYYRRADGKVVMARGRDIPYKGKPPSLPMLWIGPPGGNFSDAANWTSGAVPGPAVEVRFGS